MVKQADMTKAELLAALKKKNSKKSNGNGGSVRKLSGMVRKFGSTAERVARVYAYTNPIITVTTGRNLLHFDGDLHDTMRSEGRQLALKQPFTGGTTSQGQVMLDAWEYLSGARALNGQPDDKLGTRIKAWRAVTGYNIRSSFTRGGGIATTWGASALGFVAAAAARPLADGAASLVGEAGKLLPNKRR